MKIRSILPRNFAVLSEVQRTITPNDQTPSPQYTNLAGLIESIRKKTNDLESIWGKRRIRVELFVQMKHFEIHSREVSVLQRTSDVLKYVYGHDGLEDIK